VLHVIKSIAWVTSIATLIFAFGIARDKFLRGQNFVGGTIGSDRKTIRKRLGGGKCPARSTLTLITDGVDELGPLGAAVERSGNISEVQNRGVGAVDFGVDVKLDTEKGLGLTDGQAFKARIHTCDPSLTWSGVDLLDSAGVIDKAKILDL
jgi:hypothetical protein